MNKIILNRLFFYWVLSFILACSLYYVLWYIMPYHYVFGELYKMHVYHSSSPMQFIAILCFFYGIIATLFAGKFQNRTTRGRISLTLLIIVLTVLSNCQSQKIIDQKTKKQNLVYATIDSLSLSQIKQNEITNQTIFDYYGMETIDQVEIWSTKMFGRCCSNTDISYSQLLQFNISTNINNAAYPSSNLSDTQYRTAYVFKENQNIEILLKLNLASDQHLSMTDLPVDEVLIPNDTILKPFKLSLVNGYVKSEDTFKENGRVKAMDVFLNTNYKGTVILKDTPVVQEFVIDDVVFTMNDVIRLVPKNYYTGTKYNDICISEIQNNLGAISHSSLNEKFSVNGGSYSYLNYSGKWEYSVLGYNQVEIRDRLKPTEKGIWIAYHHNGRLACKVEYHNGKLMNVISYFDKNGNILDKGSIKGGNGVLYEYTENGKLLKEIIFSKGLIIE